MAKKALGIAIIAFLALMATSKPARDLAAMPTHLEILAGRSQTVPWDLPFLCTVSGRHGLDVNGQALGARPVPLAAAPLALQAAHPGNYTVQFSLLHLVPFRVMRVQVRPQVQVVPGGQAVGILLHPGGVLVVGQAAFPGPQGEVDPAQTAGVRPGDVLEAIDGSTMHSEAAVAQMVAASNGKVLQLQLRRDGKNIVVPVRPAWDLAVGGWRLGLFVRHTVAGVGTLTFYDPGQHVYGAVGHVIAANGVTVPVQRGLLMDASIAGIQKAVSGRPGEKLGNFTANKTPLGNVLDNTSAGVTGRIYRTPSQGQTQPVPVAMPDQVHPGPAHILTVLSGRQVASFSVRIQEVFQNAQGGRDIVFRVTDPALLRATGGVVQGMSGSPILQNGLLVGAVTHVFVNNPQQGYGIFASRMLQQAGILNRAA